MIKYFCKMRNSGAWLQKVLTFIDVEVGKWDSPSILFRQLKGLWRS